MNNDQTPRSAERSARWLATLIAVPVALLAFFVAYQALKPSAPAPAPSSTPRAIPTGPAAVAPIALDERQAAVCKALVAAMPAQVRDLPRRAVTGATDQAAAYGDLLVRCGGPQPSFAPTDFVYPLSGVCWHPDAAGNFWTTVDREVPVTVALPKELAGSGSAQWAAAFSAAVVGNVPALAVRPSGCG